MISGPFHLRAIFGDLFPSCSVNSCLESVPASTDAQKFDRELTSGVRNLSPENVSAASQVHRRSAAAREEEYLLASAIPISSNLSMEAEGKQEVLFFLLLPIITVSSESMQIHH